jgi:hypothetical protein
MNLHWRISTSESEGKPEQKFNVAFGTIFGTRQAKKLKTICACTESTDLNLLVLKKIFTW